ncbi:hypothetical protein EDB19DRAFT_1756964 [Suillus lakei]|nr:hypothetical protein EDB19DRAFT_1756964 [Suillus lakei]
MFRLHSSLALWRRVSGIAEDGPFKNSLLPKSFSFIGMIGPYYCCSNHKKSTAIMEELEVATGVDRQTLIAFYPGMSGARERLQWASNRVITRQEGVAYSLFGVFGVRLPVNYGKKEHVLGRLLQEIVARSGDITALDWVG